MGKFLSKGREKGLPCWLSQFSKTKQPTGQFFSLPSQTNFPISFKPKVAIAKFIGKMQKKAGIVKNGLDTISHFLLDYLLGTNVQVLLNLKYVAPQLFALHKPPELCLRDLM
jgi:hypothetical protein